MPILKTSDQQIVGVINAEEVHICAKCGHKNIFSAAELLDMTEKNLPKKCKKCSSLL